MEVSFGASSLTHGPRHEPYFVEAEARIGQDWGRSVGLALPTVGGCRYPTLGDRRDERWPLGERCHHR